MNVRGRGRWAPPASRYESIIGDQPTTRSARSRAIVAAS